MEVNQSRVFPVSETSQVGEARRQVRHLAERLGFDETGAARVALVVTELAGNLTKHTPQGGELVVRPLYRDGAAGLEILALDRGTGIANLPQAMRDGFSTAGTPGTGLGAVSRSAELFDVHSASGVGTALLARLWAAADLPPARDGLEVGAVCVPKPGEEACGDAWAVEALAERTTFLVADGLGHGPGAADASGEAVRIFQRRRGLSLPERLEAIHEGLRSTRGAAIALAQVDPGEGVVRYVGVGNISAEIRDGEASRSLVSHNGTAGAEVRKIQEFSYPWAAGALLVMHSDGLNTRWDLDRYPGLAARSPALVAGVLYRDFCRGRDDVTVLVARDARR